MVSFLKDQFQNFGKKSKVGKRLLHERSNLSLEFPVSLDRFYRIFIPILENPQINETGRANLNSYDIVGRAGQLFSYGGAQSRKINLTFNISLLHLLEMDTKEGIRDKYKRQFRLFFESKEKQEKLWNLQDNVLSIAERLAEEEDLESAFAKSVESTLQKSELDLAEMEDELNEGVEKPISNEFDIPYAAAHRSYYRKLAGLITTQDLEDQESNSFVAGLLEGEGIQLGSDRIKALNDLIDLVVLWVNLIRVSVLNNSSNTVYGPPIVRLNHGTLYNNVPCLVEGYDMRIVDEAGYDVETVTPKRLEISLNLVENRSGNFGFYQAGAIEDGDNITGWESVVHDNSFDPINGSVSFTRADVTVGQ
jgi:hypothetical protein